MLCIVSGVIYIVSGMICIVSGIHCQQQYIRARPNDTETAEGQNVDFGAMWPTKPVPTSGTKRGVHVG
ncbi:hypothetical protein CEXT_660071 [Caerostris extrusa]|uniref:Uncharacterized protein n=1 Tax=Caerostris extrusa TaxID=172846 RepID=A0AAV4VDV0_CAEEX|nr:hypothetical protein CEXT_660071 [Caerostris extrusa]